jgi:hypothetical protein
MTYTQEYSYEKAAGQNFLDRRSDVSIYQLQASEVQWPVNLKSQSAALLQTEEADHRLELQESCLKYHRLTHLEFDARPSSAH